MDRKLSTPRQVFLYYPQRVQVAVIGLLNLTFLVLDSIGLSLEPALVGGINTFALALLVFFYGENKTVSAQHHSEVVDAVRPPDGT